MPTVDRPYPPDPALEGVDEFAWIDRAEYLRLAGREVLSTTLVCQIKPPESLMGEHDPAVVRRTLYGRAEDLIAFLLGRGWRHVGPPLIEVKGDVTWYKDSGVAFIYGCEVRLEMIQT